MYARRIFYRILIDSQGLGRNDRIPGPKNISSFGIPEWLNGAGGGAPVKSPRGSGTFHHWIRNLPRSVTFMILSASKCSILMADEQHLEKATFAAGCFWGVEASFRQVEGVVDTAVGYTGGKKEHPTYEQVCSGTTGHAEAVLVIYDPAKITYEQLLSVFWSIHDPSQVNRQGPDIGTNYRSAIFYHTPAQKAAAEKSKEELQRSGKFKRPIATEISPASAFWRAEEYHQRYFEKHGFRGCHI
jgi:peptide-methionine (S)-S-oxide reductase